MVSLEMFTKPLSCLLGEMIFFNVIIELRANIDKLQNHRAAVCIDVIDFHVA